MAFSNCETPNDDDEGEYCRNRQHDDVNPWAWDTHGSHEHWPHTNNNDFTLWAKHHIEIFSVDMMGSV